MNHCIIILLLSTAIMAMPNPQATGSDFFESRDHIQNYGGVEGGAYSGPRQTHNYASGSHGSGTRTWDDNKHGVFGNVGGHNFGGNRGETEIEGAAIGMGGHSTVHLGDD